MELMNTGRIQAGTTAVSTVAVPASLSNPCGKEVELESIFAHETLNATIDEVLTSKNGPVIWMNGYPGTGKLTVATQLLRFLGEDNAVLIDNHQLIDKVQLSRRHPKYWEARRFQRQRAFETYVLPEAMRNKVIIFTEFQTDSDNGSETSMEYLLAARRACRLFLPVSLTCQENENIRRGMNAARCWTESGRRVNKLTDGHALRRLRRLTLFDFDDLSHHDDVKLDGLVIDVTDLHPEETAKKIVEAIEAARSV